MYEVVVNRKRSLVLYKHQCIDNTTQ